MRSGEVGTGEVGSCKVEPAKVLAGEVLSGVIDAHPNSENALCREPALIGSADANGVSALDIAAEHGGGLEPVADDRERGVVGGSGAFDERVSEGVAGVRVGRGEGADGGADGLVLGD